MRKSDKANDRYYGKLIIHNISLIWSH